MKFNDDFIWGTATAAYQIEGAYNEDGKGLSIWDTFSHVEGNIAGNANGDIACDHYHKFREDVTILKELGVKAYRFSFSWTRLFPNGDSAKNDAGFKFYDELIDELIANDITPFATLFHWDLPQALEDKGGFLWDGISDSFAEYAFLVAKHFSGKIKHFSTINEPQIILMLGHMTGAHAPGKKLSGAPLYHVMKNILLCHGKAVTAIRSAVTPDVEINVASTGNLCYPASDDISDINKARILSFPSFEENPFNHNWFLDPVILGVNKTPGLILSDEEMDIINAPIDSLGVNVYNGHEVDKNGLVSRYSGFPRTAIGWPVTEGVMNYGLTFLYERYKLPLYVYENGQACNDRIFLDGKVHDPDRIDFMKRYLSQMQLAINKGTDIRGYFVWSLLDNLEWHSGYDQRFGIVFVDYSSPERKRIIKDSGYYYSNVIRNNDWEVD